jgi:penicillin-binding protein 2
MIRFGSSDATGTMTLPEDRRRLVLRLAIVQYGVTVIFAALVLAFWYFQVVQHEKFREMAENNHQRTLGLRAPRGVLFDRGEKVLVENRDSFVISLVREHSLNLDRTVRLLAQVTGVNVATIREIIRRHRAEPLYRPIPIVEDASLAQVAAVSAHRLDTELPEVIVERVPTRRYPVDQMAAHLFGYVGEVTEGQLEGGGYHAGDVVGQAGVEKVYDKLLMGVDGARRVVVNSMGREIRTLEEVPPAGGRRVQLTIDSDLQRATEDGFRGIGFVGAAVVLDPRSGEILSYVSLPTYDPNAFAAGIDRTTWASLNADPLKPLQDRAIQGRYSPGSTFKMAVATAALEEGIITPDFKVACAGSKTFYGRTFLCWQKHGHGVVDLRHAIEQSCDVYFYTVGNMVGVDRIHKWATRLGLGVKSGIDLPDEVAGLVPSSEWKKEKTGEKWYAGETISVAIGQGQVSVTPVSMAVYAAALANGGHRVTPHLLRAVDEGGGWHDVPGPAEQGEAGFKPETISAIRDGLFLVVNGGGTAPMARIAGRDVCGKTGTAQVISLEAARALRGRTDLDLRDHGWFVFFAPRDNPEIAGVVFTEHGGHGTNAALIAHHILETYFAKKEGRPMPVFTPPAPPPPVKPIIAAPGAPTGPAELER